jgi:hypothetical protein
LEKQVSFRQQVFHYLTKHPGRSAQQLIGEMHVTKAQVTSALNAMSRLGKIHCVEADNGAFHWYPGPSPAPKAPAPKVEYINRFGDGQPYTCPELRTNPYRPGSADAYKLPSRGIGSSNHRTSNGETTHESQ